MLITPDEVNEWQRGILKLYGQVDPSYLKFLYKLAGTIGYREQMAHICPSTMQRYMGWKHRGKVRDVGNILLEQRFILRISDSQQYKRGFCTRRRRYILNPCLKEGVLPVNYKDDRAGKRPWRRLEYMGKTDSRRLRWDIEELFGSEVRKTKPPVKGVLS